MEKQDPGYRIPQSLNTFQKELYNHLISWKRKNITKKAGFFRDIPYDTILPKEKQKQLLTVYEPMRSIVRAHQEEFNFKYHLFFDHMASSQAACINLFLPILQHPKHAANILRPIKSDLKTIAVVKFDRSFRLEFWDEPDNSLNDHNRATGTDSDIAIAYYDLDNKLNLWLIEHKLSEREFTTCGAYRSAKNTNKDACNSFSNILNDNELCYYQSNCNYNYWRITKANGTVFNKDELVKNKVCPFKGGMNQLWRNLLMALAIEKNGVNGIRFNKVYFSVVHHPKNMHLDRTMENFTKLIRGNNRFSSFPSSKIIDQASKIKNTELQAWVKWYRELYYFG